MKKCEICKKEFCHKPFGKKFCSRNCYFREWKKINIERVKAYNKKVYAKNPTASKQRTIKWMKENPERRRAWVLEYNKKNSEKIKAYHKRYREKNKEKIKAKSKKRYEENKEKYLENQRKYRLRKKLEKLNEMSKL